MVKTAECFLTSRHGSLCRFGLNAHRQCLHVPSKLRLASSKEDENVPLAPETSFGADAAPEGQRPVNEFLGTTLLFVIGTALLVSRQSLEHVSHPSN